MYQRKIEHSGTESEKKRTVFALHRKCATSPLEMNAVKQHFMHSVDI